jgi:two-component system sensor histidine kinase ChvG
LINGHEEFLKRALHNIFDNAVSFSKIDGTVETNLSLASSYLTITIADNGPGIKELNTENIFNRFYTFREDNEKTITTHSGLGLHIVRQIIDAHKGNIRAENRINEGRIIGAKFIINLPINNY